MRLLAFCGCMRQRQLYSLHFLHFFLIWFVVGYLATLLPLFISHFCSNLISFLAESLHKRKTTSWKVGWRVIFFTSFNESGTKWLRLTLMFKKNISIWGVWWRATLATRDLLATSIIWCSASYYGFRRRKKKPRV